MIRLFYHISLSQSISYSRVSGQILLLFCYIEIVVFITNCVKNDQMSHSGASDMGLHCLPIAGLGGSVGCAVRLETRRSRVQLPPRSATFFRGD